MTKSPDWSAGFQLGTYGASGFTAQRAGIRTGAVNLGLGLVDGSTTASVEWILLFSQNFSRKSLPEQGAYTLLRGELNPFIGGGFQIGRGASLRFPIGVQYTFVRYPISLFGGATPLLGRFFSDEAFGLSLWFNVGARALL